MQLSHSRGTWFIRMQGVCCRAVFTTMYGKLCSFPYLLLLWIILMSMVMKLEIISRIPLCESTKHVQWCAVVSMGCVAYLVCLQTLLHTLYHLEPRTDQPPWDMTHISMGTSMSSNKDLWFMCMIASYLGSKNTAGSEIHLKPSSLVVSAIITSETYNQLGTFWLNTIN